MNKEKRIKKSYKRFWKQLEKDVQEHVLRNNGYLHQKFIGNEYGRLTDLLKMESIERLDEKTNQLISLYRPIEIKGIENNNGWIKIESENDINLFKDKERDFVFIKTSDCNESKIAVYSNLYKCFTDVYNNEIENVTHYQPIEKPKIPLY